LKLPELVAQLVLMVAVAVSQLVLMTAAAVSQLVLMMAAAVFRSSRRSMVPFSRLFLVWHSEQRECRSSRIAENPLSTPPLRRTG